MAHECEILNRNLDSDQPVSHQSETLKKIISGGQTGADRMALDFAIWHEIPHGGWCPKGRKAEDGPLEPKYLLTETPSSSYPQRTQWKVRDSNGSVIFSIASVLTGGSKKTHRLRDQTQKAMAASPSRQGPSGGNALKVYPRAQDTGSQRRGATSQQRARSRGLREASVGSGILPFWPS